MCFFELIFMIASLQAEFYQLLQNFDFSKCHHIVLWPKNYSITFNHVSLKEFGHL
jgi:hypothetical protein